MPGRKNRTKRASEVRPKWAAWPRGRTAQGRPAMQAHPPSTPLVGWAGAIGGRDRGVAAAAHGGALPPIFFSGAAHGRGPNAAAIPSLALPHSPWYELRRICNSLDPAPAGQSEQAGTPVAGQNRLSARSRGRAAGTAAAQAAHGVKKSSVRTSAATKGGGAGPAIGKCGVWGGAYARALGMGGERGGKVLHLSGRGALVPRAQTQKRRGPRENRRVGCGGGEVRDGKPRSSSSLSLSRRRPFVLEPAAPHRPRPSERPSPRPSGHPTPTIK